nr:hypothetical protein [Comamonas jiangduensis]
MQLRSLKLRLLLPYATLILLLTCAIGSLTYWAGARTVTGLSDQLLKEMASRMHQSIEHHVSGSAAVLEAAFPPAWPRAQISAMTGKRCAPACGPPPPAPHE